jgi:hypothetical protein
MGLSYLVRYGLWRQVGRFAADSPELERGQTVVVRSHRGTELGEVLTRISSSPEDASPSDLRETARVLRPANPEDLERARRLDLERPRRFELCQRMILAHNATLELIDVEPLLDGRRTVLHYLGPRRLDAAELLATLGSTWEIDGLLEPVSRDGPEPAWMPRAEDPGCAHCGSGGGCGVQRSGGGCTAGPDSAGSSCSNCATKCVLAAARSFS